MSKKRDNQTGNQMPLRLDTNRENWCTQSNALIEGKQSLKLNSAKLIRAAIMQIKVGDKQLKPYILTIPQLSELIGVDASNLYRNADEMTDDIIKNPVYIRKTEGTRKRWLKIPWVEYCEYDSEGGIEIKLNEKLKPFVIEWLRSGNFTRYHLEEILMMKSVYAIRLFELIVETLGKMGLKVIPMPQGVDIELSLQSIKQCCGCNSKSYDRFFNVKKRVIDVAIAEINEKTNYQITDYSYIKESKSVVALVFHVESSPRKLKERARKEVAV